VALGCHDEHFGEVPGLARIGQQPQPFGQELALALAVLLVAQAAQVLDRGVGETGDLAAHGPPVPTLSLGSAAVRSTKGEGCANPRRSRLRPASRARRGGFRHPSPARSARWYPPWPRRASSTPGSIPQLQSGRLWPRALRKSPCGPPPRQILRWPAREGPAC